MKDFLQSIENFFKSAWSTLVQYLHIAIPEATAKALNDLLQLADPIVADLNNQNLTGAQKREQAVSLLQGKVAQIGLDVGISLINSAIELAVLKLKATQPTTPVAIGGNLPSGSTTDPIVVG